MSAAFVEHPPTMTMRYAACVTKPGNEDPLDIANWTLFIPIVVLTKLAMPHLEKSGGNVLNIRFFVMHDDCTLTDRGTHLCPGGEEIFVRNVYPPIEELQPRVLAVVVISTLCLVGGMCGNASVLTLIYGIFPDNQLANTRPPRLSTRRSSDNTMLYIALNQLRLPDQQRIGVVNITRVRVFKYVWCSDMLPPLAFYSFTSSTFVLGYCVPLVLIVYFNSCLIQKLYRHTNQLRSDIPLRRITIYTSLIAALYFICWTPDWGTVLYATWMNAFGGDGHSESTSGMLSFIIYCLPYVRSGTNWILYGLLLNTQLQMRQHEPLQPAERRAGGASTGANNHHHHHAAVSTQPCTQMARGFFDILDSAGGIVHSELAGPN
ncbi:hypothetical protein GPALN_010708 [Globodera pallida]|nr:hypothetical protein GPALN_010708 [Globodera pallida]